MSLGNATPHRMDLAAFNLGEVEEVKPGVFRHRRSLQARIARLLAPKLATPETDTPGDTE